MEDAFASIRAPGGLLMIAGNAPAGQRMTLDPYDLIKGKRIAGSWGGGSHPDSDVPLYIERYRRGVLPLDRIVTHRLNFDQINEALLLLDSGATGRILVKMP
jgi:S-(hydroxymethyl)glutathione dehydrogenase/alcohol dehydrogenase